MMKTKKIAMLVLTCLSLLTACKKEDPVLKAAREFTLSQERYGVYQNKTEVFVMDETKHQWAYNTQQLSFRIQTDIQDRFLSMRLAKTPEKDVANTLYVESKSVSGLKDSYAVKVLAMEPEEQRIYLWESSTMTGFVMYYAFDE